MFEKIQKRLLITQPLLWNMKIVPVVSIALLFHLAFFAIGYASGRLNFSGGRWSDTSAAYAIFFSILIGLLFTVIWLVYYLRNNAYKSFYRLTKYHLFKEWLMILLVCLLNVSYSLSFICAKNLRIRSHYSYEEVKRRCLIINEASVFVAGNYYNYEDPDREDKIMTIQFNGKVYDKKSLMNKSSNEYFSILFGKKHDQIKYDMQANKQEAVIRMMRDYMAIVKEHRLETNLTATQWFSLTYHYPDFKDYDLIGRSVPPQTQDSLVIVTEDQAINATDPPYQYYVPQNDLVESYKILSSAWTEPIVEEAALYFVLYFALALSMMLFSFKVTNGRSWLFALVAMVALWITIGIASTLSGESTAFLVLCTLLMITMAVYFFTTVGSNLKKGFSGIPLNLMLWSMAGFFPAVYGIVMECFNHRRTVWTTNGTSKIVNTPTYEWLDDMFPTFAYLNIVLVVLMMLWLTGYIKKWKALAES
ncbi:hypothetical protein [Flavobacterium sp.]|uniref:hypothetical protein n=1 Tax=Flavobacterium sp. TaxID=239 RepID=UPI0039E222E3